MREISQNVYTNYFISGIHCNNNNNNKSKEYSLTEYGLIFLFMKSTND